MRSLLFVPADSPRKLEKALLSNADALILDLEDSVAASAKQAGRDGAATFLAAHAAAQGPKLIVRVNALDTGMTDADLDAVMPHRPHAIMLPKATGGEDVQHLSVKLGVREAESGRDIGTTGILPIATETAVAIFKLGTYRGASRRLIGLTWGAEDLAADIGAETNRFEDMSYTPPFALARSLMLFGAASAEVDAVDTVFANFRDSEGFRRECLAARRDGFVAKMAIHPDQVAIINEVFSPQDDEVRKARQIVEAFERQPDAGVLSIDNAMVDRPHLRKAERLLARAATIRR
ncbi:CoA ester lyase [Roseiarcaceae bacterium H3SJ34-1]|uniref:HpcH/HpaI aldolase/citrate lyase family protein n=1 Tax=Terripilifer ovatus TaxID=3032367 RepID=UPI003AB9B48D|nr:CoA ester lyase [Roseiarcaceae bacterium H3SJ34-1]